MQQPQLFAGSDEPFIIDFDLPISVILDRAGQVMQSDLIRNDGLIDDHQVLVDTIYRNAETALSRAIRCWDESGRKDGPFLAEHEGRMKAMFDATLECYRLMNLAGRIYDCLDTSADIIEGVIEILDDTKESPLKARICRILLNRARHDAVKAIVHAVRAAREANPAEMNKAVSKAEGVLDRIDDYMDHAEPSYPLRRGLKGLSKAFPVLTALGAALVLAVAVYIFI